jgi:hypothetical protein
MSDRIGSFVGFNLAIYRPIKKTYYILTWCTARSRWGPGQIVAEGLSKHQSLLHTTAFTASLNLLTGSLVTVWATGTYLYNPNLVIPIIGIRGAVPQGWKENGVCVTEERIRNVEQRLWTPPVAPPSKVQGQIPKRIAQIIAAATSDPCPITMDAITAAGVTSCYHVFDAEAITTWLASNPQCPQCREPCSVTLV